ncbi:MAG TPA: hypothetical protein ENH10_07165 [Bacteroidetes bacterium]|nr:hypothetical protein [Bacteroidota bacterium]HEX04916.1 hypothetical protein [Bacteroidota bacterium]
MVLEEGEQAIQTLELAISQTNGEPPSFVIKKLRVLSAAENERFTTDTESSVGLLGFEPESLSLLEQPIAKIRAIMIKSTLFLYIPPS